MFQPSVIVTSMTREQLQQQKVDPRDAPKNKKIKSIIEVKHNQNPQHIESNNDASQKPKLQQPILVDETEIYKNMFSNPIQIKIIKKAEDVIKILMDFDQSIGSVEQDSYHSELKKSNLSKKLSEISQKLFKLYSKAKSQNLPGMTNLNQMIQNMLQREIYSPYCQDVITAFKSQHFIIE